MKALVSNAVGGPETLVMAELPEPVAGPGEVLIAVKACSVNYPDVLIIEDRYQFKPARPFAPGSEVAGDIIALGEGVTGFAVGQSVLALTGHGGMAEQVKVVATNVFPMPKGHTYEESAALLMTYGTSIHALVDRGRIKQGDVVLVLGAAGGVGIAAVELAKAMGAKVIGAVSNEAKAQLAKEAGADDVVIYGDAPTSRDQAKALADAFKAAVGPAGADIIYDAVGGDYADPAIRCIAWEGRYLVVGFPAGIPHLPLNLTLLKSCDVCGVFWGAFAARQPDDNRANIRRLFAMWDSKLIRPRVTASYPLAEGGKAIAELGARKAVGKVVVTI